MRELPKPQELFRHFKGNLYQVISLARDSETGEELVVYQALYGEYTWYVRSLSQFMSEVDRTKYPNAGQQYRFERWGIPESQVVQEEILPKKEKTAETNNGTRGQKADSMQGQKADGTQGQEADGTRGQKADGTQEQKADGTQEPEASVDPMVMEFLDAGTHEERLNILTGLHHRITNEMLTTMAIVCDVELPGEDVQERYESLKQCLITKDRFEIKRY